jgi:hypothetical protein
MQRERSPRQSRLLARLALRHSRFSLRLALRHDRIIDRNFLHLDSCEANFLERVVADLRHFLLDAHFEVAFAKDVAHTLADAFDEPNANTPTNAHNIATFLISVTPF